MEVLHRSRRQIFCTIGLVAGFAFEGMTQILADPKQYPVIGIGAHDICGQGAWQLTFEEEFLGESLDDERWLTHFPYCLNGDECRESRVHGWPGVLSIHADSNVSVGQGTARIMVRKGRLASWYGASSVYTAGVIHSRQQFPRGRFECRMKVPESSSNRLWPAFWLFGGGSNCTEIDILEITAKDASEYHHALHRYNHVCNEIDASDANTISLNDLSDDFHVFRADWDIWFVDFFIDDQHVARSCRLYDVLNRPVSTCMIEEGIYVQNQAFPAQDAMVSIILSIGLKQRLLDTHAGTGPEIPDIPAVLEIDYVRFYRRE